MVERKIGTVVTRRNLSPILAIFRLMPEAGTGFPPYRAGQYIALRRDDCRLTRRVIGPDGKPQYVPDLDEQGRQKIGPVSHSYSIASAPYETERDRYLEFYVILERDDRGQPGRLTESLFRIEPAKDSAISYYYKIAGDFTLETRAKGFENVVMVGTGSGLAPFASMVKQLHHDAGLGKREDVRYTLFHTNRGLNELGYHTELKAIERSGEIDFVYVPSVSRPSKDDYNDASLGKGRANNLLRLVFGMPLKEEEALHIIEGKGEDASTARALLERTVRPILPDHVSRELLLERMGGPKTVILTCGNPQVMEDIAAIGTRNGIRVEKEAW